MKELILLATIISGATGCSTMKQAQTDFQNFQRTINYNANQQAVYHDATFTETRRPTYNPKYL